MIQRSFLAPLVIAPLVIAPLVIAPLVIAPLVIAPLVIAPLVIALLVIAPLVTAPLVTKLDLVSSRLFIELTPYFGLTLFKKKSWAAKGRYPFVSLFPPPPPLITCVQ